MNRRSLSMGSTTMRWDNDSPYVQNQSKIRVSQSTSALSVLVPFRRRHRKKSISTDISTTCSLPSSNQLQEQQQPQLQPQPQHDSRHRHWKRKGFPWSSAFSFRSNHSDDKTSDNSSNCTGPKKSRKKKALKEVYTHHSKSSNNTWSTSSPETTSPITENLPSSPAQFSERSNPWSSSELSFRSASSSWSSVTRSSLDGESEPFQHSNNRFNFQKTGNSLSRLKDQYTVQSDIKALCEALNSIDQVRSTPNLDSDDSISFNKQRRRRSLSAPSSVFNISKGDNEVGNDFVYEYYCGKLGPKIGLDYANELDYQQRKHFLSKRIWGNIYQARLRDPKLIVNWMCGCGHWEIEMAKEFPNAKIIGLEYKSIPVSDQGNIKYRRLEVKPSCVGVHGLEKFEENSVDFLVLREIWIIGTHGEQWARVLNQAFKIIKPGGWLEIYDNDRPISSGGPATDKLEQWLTNTKEKFGINPRRVEHIGDVLTAGGFVNINSQAVELPVGEWASTPLLKETGYWIKDLRRRRFKLRAPGIKYANHITENQFKQTLKKALDDCEIYRAHITSVCVDAQKPPLEPLSSK
ncbi:hypothetical protein BDA99DRAFT_571073 [Phascolomyces articulosus]|uniref:Methyltransferase domain-containing protein n=1 Tax=Phascolomyces articulosus TaxID=60185 RepID=A0AAD5K2R9_9FUNG|nr:hypothetical protein BDA99DRAFT_571073 [Phascolomyces articulosus]